MVDPNKRLISLIDVNPKNELVFNYIIKKTNISFINIRNISNGVIAFKVKTNKPQSYLVKPHEGILTQDQSTDVEITMQPTDYNPQTSAPVDDKFLIVAMLLPPNINPPQIPALWKSTPSEEQHQVKLVVCLKVDGTSSSVGRSSISKDPATPTADSTSTKKPEIKPEPKPEPKIETKPADLTESSTLYKSTLPVIEERVNPPVEKTEKVQPKTVVEPLITSTVTRKPSALSEGKGNDERIAQLERELQEVKADRDRLKSELEQSNIKRKAQEQFVFQLSEEKNKFENELNLLKNSTFKQRKEGGVDTKEGTKPIELWHMVVVAIICLILGAILSR